MHSGIFRRSLS